MDYNIISCGVAGQTGTIPDSAKDKIHAAIGELFKAGFRRFLIALTGDAALLFAENALTFREQYPDMGIDILLPFDGWTDEQPDVARIRCVTAQAESVNYSCEEEYEDSTDICNQQLIGFGGCTVIIHDSENKTMRDLTIDLLNADQKIKDVLI
ncbi:MAG: hypothetical protein LBQ68_06940 [Clostridiales bacterium]|jgi:uncharacterized phage-like protein YoqJ|nr:hypothetical protein [Clostridiales bacterium]